MHSSSIKRNRYTLLLMVAAILYGDASYADFTTPVRVTAGALGTELSWPAELTVYRDKLYFTAEDASGTRSLWQSDGQSTARISMPPEIPVGPGPAELTVFHNQLVFAAGDKQAGYQLWTYDDAQVQAHYPRSANAVSRSDSRSG